MIANKPLQQTSALVTAAAIGENKSKVFGSRRANPARGMR